MKIEVTNLLFFTKININSVIKAAERKVFIITSVIDNFSFVKMRLIKESE